MLRKTEDFSYREYINRKDYYDFQKLYPETYALIDDLMDWRQGCLKFSNLRDEDKVRIVSKFVEDVGDEITEYLSITDSILMSLFIANPENMASMLFRNQLVTLIWKQISKLVEQMFEAIRDYHDSSSNMDRLNNYYGNNEN